VPGGLVTHDPPFIAGQSIGDIEPGNPVGDKRMGSRHQRGGIVEGAEMDFAEWPEIAGVSLPCQRRPAVAAKCPVHARRRAVKPALVAREFDLIRLEAGQRGNRRAVVSAATATVAMGDHHGLARRLIAHRATHATARHRFRISHFNLALMNVRSV